MSKIRTIGIGAVLAAATVYLARNAKRIGRAVGARLHGMWTPADDARLARKVESELARFGRAPREKISVISGGGVVQLRGEAEWQDLSEAVAGRARSGGG